MDKKQLKLVKANHKKADYYGKEVDKLVRKRYSQSEAEAVFRHYLLDKEKYQAEFDEFNSYVETCKQKVKEELGL